MYQNSNEFSIKSWRCVEIEQQCKFGFSVENILPLLDWSCVDQYALICHDEEDVEPHCHLVLHFKEPIPTHTILNRFESVGVSFSQLEKIKSKRFSSAITYLTHENKPDKHKYSREKVISFGMDLDKVINDELKLLCRPITDIITLIEEDKINRYNYTIELSSSELLRYDKKLPILFKKQELLRVKRLKEGANTMNVYWIYGGSASGKTTYAKQLAFNQCGTDYFITSGSNDLFDGYSGEKCVIIDDLKKSNMSLSDLLHVFDNNTRTSVKSRYVNKWLFCDNIIVTSTMSPYDYWKECCSSDEFASGDEIKNVKQFLRRCGYVVQLTKETMQVAIYDVSTGKYKYSSITENHILDQFENDIEDKEKTACDFLGVDLEFHTEEIPVLHYAR